jgi:hypothetical protein
MTAVASLAVPMNTMNMGVMKAMNTMHMEVGMAMNMMPMLLLENQGVGRAAKAREPQLQKALHSTLSCDVTVTAPRIGNGCWYFCAVCLSLDMATACAVMLCHFCYYC